MASDYIDDDTINWEPEDISWPLDLDFLRDPGDIASVDCGTRSKTILRLYERGAVFICAHARTTVWLRDSVEAPLTKQELSRLILYLAWLGCECCCFRARWKHLDPRGKFCRAAAISTWRWLERTIGHEAIFPAWATRDPIGPEFTWRGEVVDDGFMHSSKRAAPRLPRRRGAR